MFVYRTPIFSLNNHYLIFYFSFAILKYDPFDSWRTHLNHSVLVKKPLLLKISEERLEYVNFPPCSTCGTIKRVIVANFAFELASTFLWCTKHLGTESSRLWMTKIRSLNNKPWMPIFQTDFSSAMRTILRSMITRNTELNHMGLSKPSAYRRKTFAFRKGQSILWIMVRWCNCSIFIIEINMSIPSWGGFWLCFWRLSNITNLKKIDFEPLPKSLHGPDLNKFGKHKDG